MRKKEPMTAFTIVKARDSLRQWAYCGCAAVLGLMVSGCTAHVAFTKRPIGPIRAYTCRQEVEGLTMAVDPITNATEVVQLFGMDLLAKGMIPVLVIASNYSDSVSYVVAPEQFRLLNGKYESSQKSAVAGTGGAEAAGWTVAVLGIGPTLIAAPLLPANGELIRVIRELVQQRLVILIGFLGALQSEQLFA